MARPPAHRRRKDPFKRTILAPRIAPPRGTAAQPAPLPTIGVCGWGRCGSSMVMHMLAAGGMPMVGDVAQPPYELPGGVRSAWSLPLAGRAVKLLDAVLYYGVPPAGAWRFVWLDRHATEQARSHVKFVEATFGPLAEPRDDAVAKFAASYRRDRPTAIGKLHGVGQVLALRYEDILADPRAGAMALLRLWPALDVDAAAAVVHDRDGQCRPDLSVEGLGAS